MLPSYVALRLVAIGLFLVAAFPPLAMLWRGDPAIALAVAVGLLVVLSAAVYRTPSDALILGLGLVTLIAAPLLAPMVSQWFVWSEPASRLAVIASVLAGIALAGSLRRVYKGNPT